MLVTDVGDDVGDGCFGHFGHQHPLSFYNSVGYKLSKYITKHKNSVTNFKSPTSLSPLEMLSF